MSDWIKTEAGAAIPFDGELVWVALPNGDIEVGVYHQYGLRDQSWFDVKGAGLWWKPENVTHWQRMTRPDPPQPIVAVIG